MATKTILGGVFTTDTDGNIGTGAMVSTENVGGLVIDTKVVGTLAQAFANSTKAAAAFGDGQVVELTKYDDIAELGLDDTVMSGLVKHHLEQFFTFAGDNQRLFLTFTCSTTDTSFSAVEKIQLASNGIIDHIGVWTSEPIATANGNAYVVSAGNVLGKLQAQAEKIGGKIGVTNYGGNSPANIIVNAGIVAGGTVDYKKLPDLTNLGFPKVSMLIGQPASDDVHAISEGLGGAMVGNVGVALGVLAIAPADVSIAAVRYFNLSSVTTTAELGFGKTTVDAETHKFTADVSFTNIKSLGYTERNDYLHKKGYIFYRDIEGIENGVFFSSDQTLDAESDYRLITRCRVMHKSRRVVRQSLLQYINDSFEVDSSTGQLSATMISTIQDTILNALDASMVQPGTTVPQISGRTCEIDEEQNVLENDSLITSYSLVPKGTTAAIFNTEGFVTTV